MKKLIAIFGVLLLAASCKKNDSGPSLNLSAAVDLLSFNVDTSKGVIDTVNAAVTIKLPFGTDFTKVVPTITAPAGASVSPASGVLVNLSNPVQYQVINGNLYKNFTVTAKEIPAIQLFRAAGDTGKIDEPTRTIKVIVPGGTDMTQVPVNITLAAGTTISPASGSTVDFTDPVVFTVTTATATVNYTVTAIDEAADKPVAYLGIYSSKDAITNSDEAAAASWFFTTYPKGEYISFDAVKSGSVSLSKYGVIWWHEDATQNLPDIAFDNAIISAFTAYRAGGGNLLLTSFAAQWLPTLSIVPSGKGPNNVFGGTLGSQFQDGSNNWGFSINPDHSSHPLFSGLPLAAEKSYPVVWLLDKLAFRLNHVSWWKVNDWGGYGDAAGWRSQTGGIDLAGPDGDANTNGNITIAEFAKGSSNGATIVITPGSYDWYAEPNPSTNAASPVNGYLSNTQTLTLNAIEYLKKQ